MQRNEDQVAKDRDFALKLQLQMDENNHVNEVDVGKLSDAFKEPKNAHDVSDEFPDDAFENDNFFDNIRKQGGLQKFIGNNDGETTCSDRPPKTAFSPENLSVSSLSDQNSESPDESSIKVTPPPSNLSSKKRKVSEPKAKKKSLKELFENVRSI